MNTLAIPLLGLVLLIALGSVFTLPRGERKRAQYTVLSLILLAFGGLYVTDLLLPGNEYATLMLATSSIQFMAFVFVSRMRNRSSFTWFMVASLFSNGTWYWCMHVLDAGEAVALLLVPYILGALIGRMSGVMWSSFIERKYDLVADAVTVLKRNSGWDYLAPARTISLIFVAALVAYVIASVLFFPSDIQQPLAVVIALGLGQNYLAALVSRISQRGKGEKRHNNIVALLSMAGSVFFFLSATYLFANDFPPELFIAYTLVTTLGSVLGMQRSIQVEVARRMTPDGHIEKPRRNEQEQRPPLFARLIAPGNRVYAVLIAGVLLWALFSETFFSLVGATPALLTLPVFVDVSLSREIVLIVITVVLVLQAVSYALVRSAGNRDHTGYHATTIVLWGGTDFLKNSYLAINANLIEIIPVAILAGALGQLYGRDISVPVERWLKARMDRR